jgi:hypothetical protein
LLFFRDFSSGEPPVIEFEGNIGVLLLGGNDELGVAVAVLVLFVLNGSKLASLLLCKLSLNSPDLGLKITVVSIISPI